jgi:hypothetical protein
MQHLIIIPHSLIFDYVGRLDFVFHIDVGNGEPSRPILFPVRFVFS